MALPGGWDDVANGADASADGNPAGVWELKIDVNARTSICCINLPFFDRENPVQNTKPARESLTKLLTGMYNDVNPVSFRREYEKDHVTLDPYYKVAPGWSTLSGGAHPYVVTAPAEFAEKCIRAAGCVPFIKSTTIYVIDNTGARCQKTLDELKALNIKVQPVPNLYKKAVAAASSSTGASSAIDLSALTARQEKIEGSLEQMRMSLNVTATLAEQVDALQKTIEKLTDAAAKAAPSAAPPAAPPAAAADAATDNEGEEDEPIRPSSRRRSKKARVE